MIEWTTCMKDNMTSDRENRILEATMDVIAQKTISGTSMRQIAERAGIAQSNVHYYFTSKDELLLAVQKSLLNKFVMQREEQWEENSDLDSKIEGIFLQKEQVLTQTPNYEYVQQDFWLRAHIDESTKANVKRNYSMWRSDVERVLKTHTSLDEEQRKRLALITISLLDGIMLQYLVDEEIDLNAYMEECKQLILGLAKDHA